MLNTNAYSYQILMLISEMCLVIFWLLMLLIYRSVG